MLHVAVCNVKNYLTKFLISDFCPLTGYVTESSLEQESASCNLITPPPSVLQQRLGCEKRTSCCLSTVTSYRVCNTSMGHMSWGNVPEPPTFDMHQARLLNSKAPVLGNNY